MIGNGLLSLEFQVDSMTLGLGGSQGFEKKRKYERINNEREKKEVEKEEGKGKKKREKTFLGNIGK